jgi:hypothetical protein
LGIADFPGGSLLAALQAATTETAEIEMKRRARTVTPRLRQAMCRL